MHKIGVVIVNYNGWQDTLACAESVLASNESVAWLVLVDNASDNNSVRWLRHWAAGRMDFVLPELGAPACSPKPLELVELPAPVSSGDMPPPAKPGSVVLLCCANNGGYAAGNNAGMRLLLAWGVDAVWILNNDTVVTPRALSAMRKRLFGKARPGLCGSLVLYADDNNPVQCRAGGTTNIWTGLSTLDGAGLDADAALHIAPETVEGRVNFIYGASVMVSRAFVEDVGLMDERYFLYCEEQDWAYRAKGRFDLAYAPEAVVYHKEGQTTGFSHKTCNPRRLWNLTRSRLLFAARHSPCTLPTVLLSIAFAALRLVWRRLRARRSAST